MFQRPHQGAQVVRGQGHGSGAAGAHPGGAEGKGDPGFPRGDASASRFPVQTVLGGSGHWRSSARTLLTLWLHQGRSRWSGTSPGSPTGTCSGLNPSSSGLQSTWSDLWGQQEGGVGLWTAAGQSGLAAPGCWLCLPDRSCLRTIGVTLLEGVGGSAGVPARAGGLPGPPGFTLAISLGRAPSCTWRG